MINIIIGIVLVIIIADLYYRVRRLQKRSLAHEITCDALYDIISFWMNYDKEKIDASFETARRKYIAGYADMKDEKERIRRIDEIGTELQKKLDDDFKVAAARQEAYNKKHHKA